MMGYYEILDLEYEGGKSVAAGMSDDIKVKLGRIRDYDGAELNGAFATGLTMTTAAMVAMLLS